MQLQLWTLLLSLAGLAALRTEQDDMNTTKTLWKMCNKFRWFSSQKERSYYFQSEDQSGDPTAIKFIRHPTEPAIIFHKHQEWAARFWNFIGDSNGDLIDTRGYDPSTGQQWNGPMSYKHYGSVWHPVPPLKNARVAGETVHVPMSASQLEYVRCYVVESDSPCILEIKSGGTTYTLAGGMYFSDDLARLGTRHFKSAPPPDITATRFCTDAGCPLYVAESIQRAAADKNLDLKVNDFRKFAVLRDHLAGCATVGALVGGPGGFIVGAGVGVGTAAARGLYHIIKRKSDDEKFASEKIFEKVRCLSFMRDCGNDVLAPKSKGCPQF